MFIGMAGLAVLVVTKVIIPPAWAFVVSHETPPKQQKTRLSLLGFTGGPFSFIIVGSNARVVPLNLRGTGEPAYTGPVPIFLTSGLYHLQRRFDNSCR